MTKKGPADPVADALVEMRASLAAASAGYRERSLKLHGPVCARCGREFSGKNMKLLTVHHKDGDPANNPPDGSNWENLCVYCHDAEHSRELLGDYENGRSRPTDNTRLVHGEEKPALGSFADLLAKARKK